jgi:hypothetical protein
MSPSFRPRISALNDLRRQSNDSQRALFAARLVGRGRGRPAKNTRIRAITLEDATRRVGVKKTLVQAALTVLRRGVPGLVELVHRGEVKASAAALVAGLKPAEQDRLVAGGAKAVRSRAAVIRSENKSQRARAERSPESDARNEVEHAAAADEQPGRDSAAERSDAGAEQDELGLATAQDESQSAGHTDEADKPIDVGEAPTPEVQGATQVTTRGDEAPGPGHASAGPVATPSAPDPSDRDAREAGGATRRAGRAQVEVCPPADPPPSPDALPIEDIPLRARLGDPSMFDANARLWRRIRPSIEEEWGRLLEDPEIRRVLETTPWSANVFARGLDKVFRTPPPEKWVVCWKCAGTGRTDAAPVCGACGGACHQCA